ncbi:hypothetical protein EUGRSUZ_C01886 [Eucalyptus grandis]|uniref:Uncharacterized protein n=2 Tax=Eucalyptus grandis TaxID=71139 RepID=A0ACC3LEB5_EUCGR|nr:hypothetical protein EUGRSUZ_C01886 [Eucalyptus grandis]
MKRVKQEVPEDWDESMPLPGGITEGFAEDDADDFVPTKARSEFNSQLGKISQQVETLWVKVRRGDRMIKLWAHIVPLKGSMLTFQAVTDDRHAVVLGDLNLEKCTKLQGFKKKGMQYDWKAKVGTYLPDQWSPVVSSILFMLLPGEHTVEATTTRSMAWFSASVSSGIPLIFVNIQTEQMITSVNSLLLRFFELLRSVYDYSTFKSIYLLILGIGFICIFSMTKGSAADRTGLGRIHKEANAAGHLLVASRLEGKSQMPSHACSEGLYPAASTAT